MAQKTTGWPIAPTPRVVYRENPLAEVICQFRFPTILDIRASDPAAFQERVRNRYPFYDKELTAGLPSEIAELMVKLPIKLPVEEPTHQFATTDRSKYISLTSGFIALTDKDYRRWEDFRQEVLLIDEAFRAVYKPDPYTRIGLRYVNVIDKERIGLADVPWSELINPALTGLLALDGIRDRVTGLSGTVLLEIGDMVGGGVARIQHGLASNDQGHLGYHLDADFATDDRRASDDVRKVLDVFHDLAGNLFRWSITTRLENALEPTPLD